MLHQLLLNETPMVSKLQSGIRQAGPRLTEDSSALWKLFSEACQYLTGATICVLDALDECDPESCRDLIQNIGSVLGKGKESRAIKFLITTRGYPRLLKQFKAYESGLIHLDGDGKKEKDAIQQEISLVLNYRLSHLSTTKKLDQQPARKRAIEKALKSKGSEQKTYLWLKLVFVIMEQIPWKSDRDWERVIMAPPQSVNDAYATLLQNVPEEEKEYVNTILHLMFAAYRPLTLREMSIAIMVRDSLGAPDEESLGLQSDEEFKDWIIHTCGFFVTVYDNELYFIHQTAKEFLEGSGTGTSCPEVLHWISPVTIKAAHKTMAECSIAYLSLECFGSTQFQEVARMYHSARLGQQDRRWHQLQNSLHKDCGFLAYTTKHWTRHFRLCQSFDGQSLRDVGDAFVPYYISLFTTSDGCAPGWSLLDLQRRPKQTKGISIHLARSYDTFTAALWFDHGRLLWYSLQHDASPWTFLLHAAASVNANTCVQYLAVIGFDVNAQDESGHTALCLATRHKAIVAANVLLDYHANVNIGRAFNALPLSYAMTKYNSRSHRVAGGLELVRRIVCQGADLNKTRLRLLLQPSKASTALAWASITEYHTLAHNDNIRRLENWILRKTSDLGLRTVADLLQSMDLFSEDIFLTAYSQSLIKLLLDHRADIDGATPSPHAKPRPTTALEVACFTIHDESSDHVFWNAAFLLYGGADSQLNAGTEIGALHWLLHARSSYALDNVSSLGFHHRDRLPALAVLLLKYYPASVHGNNPFSAEIGGTHLLSLCQRTLRHPQDRQMVELILEHGAQVDFQDSSGRTPMHHLVSRPSKEVEVCAVIEMLIENGATLEVRDTLGMTPMHFVRSPDVVDTLVQYGADIEARDNRGNTPLQAVVGVYRKGSSSLGDGKLAKVVKAFVSIGADVTARNCLGETAIHIAAKVGFADCLPHLLHVGADLDAINSGGETPLQVALHHRFHEAAAVLLGRGADTEPILRHNFDTEQRDQNTGATLLAFATSSHFHDVMRLLLRRGANPNALPVVDRADVVRSLDRVDCMQIENKWAARAEMLELQIVGLVNSALRRGIGYDEYRTERPLHLAMRSRWSQDSQITVDLLLRHGANIEATSHTGWTPLQVACVCGSEQGVRFLLQMGANVDETSRNGRTALDAACIKWQPDPGVIRVLLSRATTSYAGDHDLYKIARAWTKPPNQKDFNKRASRDDGIPCCQRTSLNASSHDTRDLECRSVDRHCKCRHCCQDHEGQTCAAAQILLDAGAWNQLRYYQGNRRSPIKVARKNQCWDLANLLEKAAVPHWRRAWLPSNADRRSMPAAIPHVADLHLQDASETPSSEFEFESPSSWMSVSSSSVSSCSDRPSSVSTYGTSLV